MFLRKLMNMRPLRERERERDESKYLEIDEYAPTQMPHETNPMQHRIS
jgi:hypothetical protein